MLASNMKSEKSSSMTKSSTGPRPRLDPEKLLAIYKFVQANGGISGMLTKLAAVSSAAAASTTSTDAGVSPAINVGSNTTESLSSPPGAQFNSTTPAKSISYTGLRNGVVQPKDRQAEGTPAKSGFDLQKLLAVYNFIQSQGGISGMLTKLSGGASTGGAKGAGEPAPAQLNM